MGRGPPLSDEERGRIRRLHEAGWGIRRIARQVKRAHATVSSVVAVRAATEKKRMGPEPLLTDGDVRQIVRATASGDFNATDLKKEYKLKCSTRTIRCILSRVDWLVYTKMEITLPLTPEHMAARRAWAKDMLMKRMEWETVIFSDDKKFNLDGPYGFKFYWRDLRKPAKEAVRRQNGGGSVMLWGGFSAKGKTELAVLKGMQNSDDYVYMVSEFLLPFAHLTYGTDFIYQQDNASIHTSKRTKDFFEEQALAVLDWPARSPDLNSIENLWSILAQKVYSNGKQYRNVSALTVAILAAWSKIDTSTLVHLVVSMPKRCIEVIELNGKKTHY